MKKGSITIYLSLVLISILLIISVIIESARMNAVQAECKSFSHLAVDSVLAGYARQVYEDYGILLVWEDKKIEEQLMKYLQANINLADLKIGGTNIMATRLKEINLNKTKYVVGNGGKEFINQILSYMKYAIATESVNKFMDLYSNNSSQKKIDTSEYMINVKEENSSEISDIVKNINNKINDLKEVNIKNKLKTEKSRTGFLEEINEIIEEMEVYMEEKKEFLKENKGLSGDDYMDSNLKILEQIKNKIKQEKLSDSSITKEEWKHIGEEINEQIKDLTVNISTKEDEENKSIYENARKLLEKSILSIVIEDTSNVSSASISDSNLPSKKEYSKNTSHHSITDKTKMIMYAAMKFGDYHNIKKKSDLSYELEYIIGGKNNDRSNLTATVERMVAVRNIETLSYLLTDRRKMAELSSTASSVATAMGLPFLEPVIKAVLTEAWAMSEAVNDVKIVMAGNKIDFIKNNENWKSSLKNLFASKTAGSDKKGSINYQQFCCLLMMKEDMNTIAVRMMDIIQVNVKKNYNQSFNINQCFTGFRVEIFYEAEPLFVSMPGVIHNLGEKIGAYNFSIECKAEY